jgi:hypothetical protein
VLIDVRESDDATDSSDIPIGDWIAYTTLVVYWAKTWDATDAFVKALAALSTVGGRDGFQAARPRCIRRTNEKEWVYVPPDGGSCQYDQVDGDDDTARPPASPLVLSSRSAKEEEGFSGPTRRRVLAGTG